MILSSTIYDLLLTECRKDRRGKSISVDEYNQVIEKVNLELFADYYREFEKNIESSDTLGGLKVFHSPVVLTAGENNTVAVGTLPADYYHIIGKPKFISGSTVRWLDVVSTYEHAARVTDYLTQATATHPYCMIGGLDDDAAKEIRVYPYNLGTPIYLDYLKTPATPFLDYYINNTTFNYTWLDADDTAVNIPAGYTYRDGTVGGPAVNIDSATVNFEWSEDDLPLIIAKLMTVMGIQLPDEILMQAGTLNENKILR